MHHTKILAERSEKYPKIFRKTAPGGSPEPPEAVREPSGARPSEENARNRFSTAKKQRVIGTGAGFGSPKIIVFFAFLRFGGHEKKLCGDNVCEQTFFEKGWSPDAFWDAPGLRFDVILGSKMGLF